MIKRDATLDDLFHTRDASGEVIPIEFHSPVLDAIIRFKPLTWGYLHAGGDDLNVSAVNWPLDRKIELLRGHVTTPDCSELTREDFENSINPMAMDHLVAMVVFHSSPFSKLQRGNPELLEHLTEELGRIRSDGLTDGSTDLDIDSPDQEISTNSHLSS